MIDFHSRVILGQLIKHELNFTVKLAVCRKKMFNWESQQLGSTSITNNSII